MVKVLTAAGVVLGWAFLFGLVLALAYARSKRKSLAQKGFRYGPRLTSAPEPVILPPIAKSRPKGRERGTQRRGVKAVPTAWAN